ncbi:MAG: general secretion pathway protein GspK [Hyphomonadaceae bacterium JAD_PAG50586_4]|nr:MAG: general secretion pathway protein GspK [Hyphomonadaceae bacterium JAD_PAG50586_4]
MRGAESGYALLLAIVVVSVLAFSVLASAKIVGDVAASASRLRENADQLGAENAATRVAFLLLTEDMDGRALQMGDPARWDGASLALDGQLYAVADAAPLYVSVQDEAGLLNLNGDDQRALISLLVLGGAGEAAPALAARLADYIDADDLVRDGGAEQAEYRRARMPAPGDQSMAVRWQALEVLGWRAHRMDRRPVWDWLTTGPPGQGPNINTAPQPVLEALLDDRRLARTIIQRREASPLTDLMELQGLIGEARSAQAQFSLLPGREFRVRAVLSSSNGLNGIERRLELGGEDAAQPFRWVEQRDLRLTPIRDDQAISALSLATTAP